MEQTALEIMDYLKKNQVPFWMKLHLDISSVYFWPSDK